jgi:hypothetical protein
MPIIAENNGTNHVPIPAGNHIARCVEMIHVGTITEDSSSIYAGKEVNKVRLSWETPDELHDFGKGLQPFMISKEFTLSMNEKATLRKMLESWRGQAFTEDEAKAFDVTRLLTKACMLSVIHKTSRQGKLYAEISSIAALPKGFDCPPQVNPTKVLSFDEWDQTLFDSLPDFLKGKIRSSRQYAAMMNPGVTEAAPASSSNSNDDLPF